MKKRWFIAPVAAGVLTIGGMAAFAEDTGKLAPVETAAAKVKQVASDWISEDEAQSIALEAAGGGEVREMELDRDDQEYEFEIRGESGEVEVKIDAKSGKVLKTEQDDQDDDQDDRDDDDRQAAPDNLISENEAIKIAKGKAGSGAEVIEAELDEDDGRWNYEVELRDDKFEYEVDIDAENGNIIDFEKDED
ncbi:MULTISPECIES: PepSY domain-containing protein [Bhargavaea]|uniref:PepSY domain-containing protein n=1 Tax=Bhargavaea changchunensis TaxID=2134037 RepID=A0ABW2NAK8_9BACL|nr:PepSY domain-containing protein [Bhargavaea sp. CC-171006]